MSVKKIWTERDDQDYFLRLTEDDSDIDLEIVDRDGDQCSYVLHISKETGELRLTNTLDPHHAKSLGLKLDSEGKIAIKKDDQLF